MLPLITAPKHITASYLPLFAILLAISGISKAPGTHATSTSSSLTLWRINPSIAPDNNFPVINSLNLAATIPILTPFDTNLPSNLFMSIISFC